ncbi:S8 family serine peptidase [Luteimonas sp. MC1895]|uniref:S8 family serine peptidase n=1 Tax=Luteimonas sp. MC1895 TaxID=2819513 RepID=UPI0018F0889E|nr:S8 family serine peptidase [Luteimonas sp. MC1895]MBJ6979537.1 S8 family serine peptidase [Luteimonas sp. MC1895]
MKSSLAMAVATAVVVTAAGAAAVGVKSRMAAPTLAQPAPVPAAIAMPRAPKEALEPHIVLFAEPALASYRGGVRGIDAPARRAGGRLDVGSRQAGAYVDYLRSRQAARESDITRSLGRGLDVSHRMQHAVNGIVVALTPSEAARIARMRDVRLVEGYREYTLDTDTGPRHIGAAAVWSGAAAGSALQGEGMVAAILDSGINFGSPSFAALDPTDGYAHVNPLGAGNYLGTCAPGGVDEGRCNDKLIGGYDFVCEAPGDTCSNPGFREEPGFGDTSSHGTHVASTVAGNRRTVGISGAQADISGVAPRASLIALDICYTNIATGQGLCPNVSAVAAVDQVIKDGVADVINYSIGGGAQPWSEAVSLAFLDVVASGVFVASSAGNSGPAANTLGHLEPWVSATAAAQHGREGYSFLMQVTGPGTVPEPLTAIELTTGSNGVGHTAAYPATTPLRVSPNIDAIDDGCAGYPAGSFAGAIAVVRRGSCSFTIKVNAAGAAGAVAVVIANNVPEPVLPSVPDTTVPAFGVDLATGNALRNFHQANPAATAAIGFPAAPVPNTPDALASFSSRGPAGTFSLIKPDVTAPGYAILAAVAGTTITGFENAVGLMNGTSMASPHQAGAALLVRQARPDWSVSEVKSALAMTATSEVFLEDEVTRAGPFARGSGRIRVDQALRAGLVLDESAENYLAANPATGGDPSALNLPSLANRNCETSCTFSRTVRNVDGRVQTWSASLSGLRGKVTPIVVRIPANGTATFQVTIDSSSLSNNGSWNFGNLRLKATSLRGGKPDPVLNLPIGVAVQPPVVNLPAVTSATVAAGGQGSVTIPLGNTGGSVLAWSVDNTGDAISRIVERWRGAVGSGFRATRYTDPASAGGLLAQFSGDDFVVDSATRITGLSAEGFVVSGAALAAAAQSLQWSIYPDAAGVPAGNPQTNPAAAVWTYSSAPTGAGVSLQGGRISLDLAAAGQAVNLAPGRYWVVINTTGSFANRWAWFGSADGAGGFAGINIAANGTGSWIANTAFNGLDLQVDAEVPCGASWLGAIAPAAGSLQPGDSRPLVAQLLANGLAAGSYTGYACVASNDPVSPLKASRVALTVTP